MYNGSGGNALIRIDARKLPIFIFLNQLRIMLHL